MEGGQSKLGLLVYLLRQSHGVMWRMGEGWEKDDKLLYFAK